MISYLIGKQKKEKREMKGKEKEEKKGKEGSSCKTKAAYPRGGTKIELQIS